MKPSFIYLQNQIFFLFSFIYVYGNTIQGLDLAYKGINSVKRCSLHHVGLNVIFPFLFIILGGGTQSVENSK
jgi:hypothetical protein